VLVAVVTALTLAIRGHELSLGAFTSVRTAVGNLTTSPRRKRADDRLTRENARPSGAL
jgi:hypothetical protein